MKRKSLREIFLQTKDLPVSVSTSGIHYSDDYVHWLEELAIENHNKDIAIQPQTQYELEVLPYKNIQTKHNYELLLNSGMFWEVHPELSGCWEKDKDIIQNK